MVNSYSELPCGYAESGYGYVDAAANGSRVPGELIGLDSKGLDTDVFRAMQALWGDGARAGSTVLIEDKIAPRDATRLPKASTVVDWSPTTGGSAEGVVTLSGFPITLATLVYIADPTPPSNVPLISWEGGGNNHLSIWADTTGFFQVRRFGSSDVTTVPIKTGWNFVAAHFPDATSAEVYSMGVYESLSGLTSATFSDTTSLLHLGKHRLSSPIYFNGKHAFSAVFNTSIADFESVAWELERLTSKYYAQSSIAAKLESLIGISNVKHWWDAPGVDAGVQPSALIPKIGNPMTVVNGDVSMVIEDGTIRSDWNATGGSIGANNSEGFEYNDLGYIPPAAGRIEMDFMIPNMSLVSFDNLFGAEDAASANMLAIRIVTGEIMRLRYGNDSAAIDGPDALVEGQIYNLALDYEAGAQELFLNGVSIGTSSEAGVPTVAETMYLLGANTGGTGGGSTRAQVYRFVHKDGSGAVVYDTREDGFGTPTGPAMDTIYVPTSLADETLDVAGNAAQYTQPVKLPGLLKYNPCVDFDSAKSQYGTIANTLDWSAVDWEWSAWVKVANWAASNQFIFSQASGTGAGGSWVYLTTSNFYTSIGGGKAFTTIPLPTTEWAYISMSHDGAGNLTLSVTPDGGETTTETVARTFPSADGQLQVATNVSVVGFGDVAVAGLKLYREGELWVHLRVTGADEGQSEVIDASGNGRNLTLVNNDASTWLTTQNVYNGYQDAGRAGLFPCVYGEQAQSDWAFSDSTKPITFVPASDSFVLEGYFQDTHNWNGASAMSLVVIDSNTSGSSVSLRVSGSNRLEVFDGAGWVALVGLSPLVDGDHYKLTWEYDAPTLSTRATMENLSAGTTETSDWRATTYTGTVGRLRVGTNSSGNNFEGRWYGVKFCMNGETIGDWPVQDVDAATGTVLDISGYDRHMTLSGSTSNADRSSKYQPFFNYNTSTAEPNKQHVLHGSNVLCDKTANVTNVDGLTDMPYGAGFNGTTSTIVTSSNHILWDTGGNIGVLKADVFFTGASVGVMSSVGGTDRCSVSSTGTIGAKDGVTTLSVTPSKALVTNGWNRIEWHFDVDGFLTVYLDNANTDGRENVGTSPTAFTNSLFVGQIGNNPAGLCYIRAVECYENGVLTGNYDLLGDALDSSGNNNHGTPTDIIWLTESTNQGEAAVKAAVSGANFNGVDSIIDLTERVTWDVSAEDLDFSVDLNLALFSNQTLMGNKSDNRRIGLYSSATTLFINATIINLSSPMPLNTWFRLRVTLAQTTGAIKVYLDGVDITSGTPAEATDIRFDQIGARFNPPANLFASAMKNLTLTLGGVDALDMPLEEDARDYSGNANHGTPFKVEFNPDASEEQLNYSEAFDAKSRYHMQFYGLQPS